MVAAGNAHVQTLLRRTPCGDGSVILPLIRRPGGIQAHSSSSRPDTTTPDPTCARPVEYLSLIGKQGERAHLRAVPRV